MKGTSCDPAVSSMAIGDTYLDANEPVEGLIYAPEHPDGAKHDPLFLWRKDVGQSVFHATSRVQPTGFNQVGTDPVGFLPRKQPQPQWKKMQACGCAVDGGTAVALSGLLLGAWFTARRRATRRSAGD